MTVPNSAKFSTSDCLNTPEMEAKATEETLKESAAKFLLEQIISKPSAPGFWTDFHDEITTLLADFACIVALPIVRERIELMTALKAVDEQLKCPMRNTVRGNPHGYAVIISTDVRQQVEATILKVGGK